jgi:hypothetical protein
METKKSKYGTTPVRGSEGVYSRYRAGTGGHYVKPTEAPSPEHTIESGQVSEEVKAKETKKVEKE